MLFEKVKQSLRIKSSKVDEEIYDLIRACKIDLKIGGVKNTDETDALIQRAIILYCKANFGLENKESEKYNKSYELLKQSLSLCSDYNRPSGGII